MTIPVDKRGRKNAELKAVDWITARVTALGFVTAALIFLFYCYLFFNFAEDDAFIPMRYSLNFWHGYGWVMNAGEHVEACTSPLELALVTLIMRFSGPDTTLCVLKFFGLLIGLAVLRQAQRLGEALFPGRAWLPVLVPVVIALRPDFSVSMINGLETGLATLLVTGGATAFVRAGREEAGNQRPAALWFLGAALARPELSLIFPLLQAGSLWTAPPARLRLPAASWYLALAWYLGPLALFLLARFAYYGALVPNTYWAKHLPRAQAEPQGLAYLGTFALPGNAWLAAALYSLGAFRILRQRGPAKWVIFVPLILHALFLLRSGGDWMADGRFFIVMLPLCALVWCAALLQVAEAFGWIAARWPRMRAAAYLAFLLLLAVTARMLLHDDHTRKDRLARQPGIGSFKAILFPHVPLEEWKVGNADGRLAIGRWITAHVRPGQTVLTSEMGLDTVTNPQVRFLDIRGLADRQIARMPGMERDQAGGQGEREWMDLSTPLGQYLHRRRPEWVALLWDVHHSDREGINSANDLYAPDGAFKIHCDGRILTVATWKRRDISSPL